MEVWIDGVKEGETPVRVTLDTTRDHVIVFKRDGVDAVTVRVERRVGGGFIFLDIITGLVPLIIDAATGGWYLVSPKSVHVIAPDSFNQADTLPAETAPEPTRGAE